MSFSTFSGPVRSGTVRFGAAENTGLMMLARSATVASSAMTTSPSAQTLFTLPAGSKIMRFQVEVTTAISGGSVSNVGLTIGKVGGTANFFVTTFNTGLTANMVAQSTVDAAMQVAETNNIGTTDVAVTGAFTAAGGNPTAGQIVVTVLYIQRADNGAQAPTFQQV